MGFRRQVIGNVLGSNLFNMLAIAGITALVVPVELLAFDSWVMLGATGGLLLVIILGRRIGRLRGAGLIAAYGAYITLIVGGGAIPAM